MTPCVIETIPLSRESIAAQSPSAGRASAKTAIRTQTVNQDARASNGAWPTGESCATAAVRHSPISAASAQNLGDGVTVRARGFARWRPSRSGARQSQALRREALATAPRGTALETIGSGAPFTKWLGLTDDCVR